MRNLSLLMFAALLCIGCGGSGASSDGGERIQNTVRASLGTSSADHIIRVAEDVLVVRSGYQFERRIETTEDIRLETSWRELPATDDEKALGFGYSRIRITVRARPRDRAAGTYSVSLNGEVEARGPTGDIWAKIPLTEGREEYFDQLITYFENEFKGGVR